MNWAVLVWFVLMVIFVIIEANTVAVVSAWFAVGSLAAMIVSLVSDLVWLQVLVFLAVSAVLMLLLRPLVKKYFTPKLTKTNIDTIAGSTGLVTQEINNDLSQGQVKLGGLVWTARSTGGGPIPAGKRIYVDRLEGVKVYVSEVQ